MTCLEKLISASSPSLGDRAPEIASHLVELAGSLSNDLMHVLRRRNGFYALEKALHLFPAQSTQFEIGLDDWNSEALWRGAYRDMADGCLFFAEDVFGGQFCIKNSRICTFDPETGSLEHLADDFEDWARAIVSDFNSLTGYPLAHHWQEKNGEIPRGNRLLPKKLFVAGGEFELSNLYLGNAVQGMRFRAKIASQIRELPDGSQVEFTIVD